jgi:hypothetical protein
MSKSIILDVVLADPKAEIEIELNTRCNKRRQARNDKHSNVSYEKNKRRR